MNPLTILIADDEPPIRHMLDLKLHQAGFKVVTASNGQAAYELACEHNPSLIVSDYQMPGMDGLEFCQQLATNSATSEIPVIMLTARAHKIPRDEIAKTNICCFLDKPFSPRDLISKIRELLHLHNDESVNPNKDGLSAA